jgi:UDP-perosamine 4-acetyltransferase
LTEPVLVLGCGGHAKVIIEVVEQMEGFSVHGCVGALPAPDRLLDYPVLGPDKLLPEIRRSGVRHAIVAVGDNAVRRKLTRLVREMDFRLIRAVSRHAIVSPRSQIGEGAAVLPGAVLNTACAVGESAIINTGATVDHDCRIGDYVHIAPGVHLAGGVSVGEGTLIGVGASVIPGIKLGEWAVVGAGAVVTSDVPDGLTVLGIPARPRPGSDRGR